MKDDTGGGRRKPRVSRDDWLAKALEVLESEGVEAVHVERLAREIGVSKSGFYWHFRDRRDLLSNLLNYWAHEYTEVVTENPLLRKSDPAQRLENTMAMIDRHDLAKFDLVVRAWAKKDEEARAVVETVTDSRIQYIRQAFRDLGFEGDEAEMRAALFVCYHTWEKTIFPKMSKRRRARLRKRRLALLTSR